MAATSAFVVLLVFVDFISCTSSVYGRLHCLENNIGKELNNTPWSWGPFSTTTTSKRKDKGWVYNNTQCPLSLFNEKLFCTQAVQCGKSLLLVGDSTVMRMVSTLEFLLDRAVSQRQCRTENFCGHKTNPESTSRCIRGGHNEMVWSLNACQKHCPINHPVQINYIRHDYLTHIHGERNFQSTICEEWKNVAHEFDYLLISVGPHINGMLTFPFGRQASSSFNATEFLRQEALDTTNLLLRVIKPTASVIYRTGPVGLVKYSSNCSDTPLDSPPIIQDLYDWRSIPKLNSMYIKTLRDVLGNRVSIMDTTTLNSKMNMCRQDHLHFNHKNTASPVLLEWVVLYNILLERVGIKLDPLPQPKKPSYWELFWKWLVL